MKDIDAKLAKKLILLELEVIDLKEQLSKKSDELYQINSRHHLEVQQLKRHTIENAAYRKDYAELYRAKEKSLEKTYENFRDEVKTKYRLRGAAYGFCLSLVFYGLTLNYYNPSKAIDKDFYDQEYSKHLREKSSLTKQKNLCKAGKDKLLDMLQRHTVEPEWSQFKNKVMPQPVWMTDSRYDEYLESFKFDKGMGNSYAHKQYQNFMYVIRNAR